jgi:hypothetical protein
MIAVETISPAEAIVGASAHPARQLEGGAGAADVRVYRRVLREWNRTRRERPGAVVDRTGYWFMVIDENTNGTSHGDCFDCVATTIGPGCLPLRPRREPFNLHQELICH